MQDWDDYGIEWNGPTPLETVIVDEIDDTMSPQQQADLDGKLSEINPTMAINEDMLINQFTVAKMFIHQIGPV